jgi:hypothetical protein
VLVGGATHTVTWPSTGIPAIHHPDPEACAEHGGRSILAALGRRGLVIDLGQSRLKLAGTTRRSYPRDFTRIPPSPRPVTHEGRDALIAFVAAALREAAEDEPPHALVLALPCEISADGALGTCSYPWSAGDPIVPEILAAAGLAHLPCVLLNDAELAAIGVAAHGPRSPHQPSCSPSASASAPPSSSRAHHDPRRLAPPRRRRPLHPRLHPRARPRAVTVLTVFSDGDASHHERRAEDLAALTHLGATPLHLGLRDAPQRLGLPRSFRDLILRPQRRRRRRPRRPHPRRPHHPPRPTLTLLPLGVGEHIDHRLVHAAHASSPARSPSTPTAPTPTIRHATRARLLRLAATVDGQRLTPRPTDEREFLAAAALAPHLRAYLPADEREPCLRALARPLTIDPDPATLHLHRESSHFPAATRRAAVLAIRSYRSQLADLFADHDPAAAFTASYRETLYWRR